MIEPHRWYQVAPKLGAFVHDSPAANSARSKLRLLGLYGVPRSSVLIIGERFNESFPHQTADPKTVLPGLNLCPPAPQQAPWDMWLAGQVADLVRLDRQWEGKWLILCGRRVSAAFGVPRKWPWGETWDGRFVPVPHPSGLSRFWNDEIEVQVLCENLSSALTSLDA